MTVKNILYACHVKHYVYNHCRNDGGEYENKIAEMGE